MKTEMSVFKLENLKDSLEKSFKMVKENYFQGICCEDTCSEDGEHYIEFTLNGLLLFFPLCPKHYKIYLENSLNKIENEN